MERPNSPNPVQVWTIGHSTRTLKEFLSLLRQNQIEQVADVRRHPGSRRLPQYGQAALTASLAAAEMDYVHLPELGGRRRTSPTSLNAAWRNASFRGYADYMETEAFRQGIDRLLALAQGKRTAIMCAEVLWWRCHRALISDYLKAAGYSVCHILSPTKVEPHRYSQAAKVEDGRVSYHA